MVLGGLFACWSLLGQPQGFAPTFLWNGGGECLDYISFFNFLKILFIMVLGELFAYWSLLGQPQGFA
ncbi:MAG: hypothetical protein GX277_08955, partial [Bacteroidales bacterium]|nr:hypothetical protein [Bacteroidales bacterium]